MSIKTWIKDLFKRETQNAIAPTIVTYVPVATEPTNTEKQQGDTVSTSDTIKEKLIAMAIPLALKLAERELPKLIDKYMSAEKIDELVTKGLVILKKKVKETPNEWDDVLTKPFISLVEEVFGLSAEANLEPATDTSASVEEVIAQKVAETVLDSIKL